VIEHEYFDFDVAHEAALSLHEALMHDRYDGVATAEALAGALNRDLYAATRDKHLVVSVLYRAPRSKAEARGRADEARAVALRRSNHGVRQVEILPGDVGYLDLSAFYRPEEARDTLSAAMHLLKNTDALIIDMRNNTGGSPSTVALLVSYMFNQPGLPLFDIVHRPPEPTDHYYTEPTILPDSNSKRPVYVLTAARTFSAGEGFAFILEERHRAEVIGETTAGAANPGRPYPINDLFSIVVPNGRIRSAISSSNWEGMGVTPDVHVAAAEAFRAAYRRALGQLLNAQPAGEWQDALKQVLRHADSLSP
jgi:C-terminal processing protease CtpA/Prc